MWTPHALAKYYKRHMGDQTVKVKNDNAQITLKDKTVVADSNVILFQGYRYVYDGTLKWIEDSAKESGDEDFLNGMKVENEYLSIKTNSTLNFAVGDIIELPKNSPFAGLWIVQSGKSIDYVYTPKPIQTFQHIPLSSLA